MKTDVLTSSDSGCVSIPPALLVVIDDVGWWSGFDGSQNNEPFRTGMGRMHTPEDYSALVRLGQQLGTQVIAGLVLCEWDRTDRLSTCPSTTWMGARWKGPMKGSPLPARAAALLNRNLNHVHIAIHGVGHECWDDGTASRSEFHNEHGEMRDQTDVTEHLAVFGELLSASGIQSPPPRIFIPPALKHSFGNGDRGFQRILSEFGVDVVLTVFEKARQYAPPLYPGMTRECGVTLMDRGLSPVPWNTVAAAPLFDVDQPFLPLHWANILHACPDQNTGVVDAWAKYLRSEATRHGFLILPDVESALAQIAFYRLTRIEPRSNGAILDISSVRSVFPQGVDRGFYLTVQANVRIQENDGILTPDRYGVRCLPSTTSDRLRFHW